MPTHDKPMLEYVSATTDWRGVIEISIIRKDLHSDVPLMRQTTALPHAVV